LEIQQVRGVVRVISTESSYRIGKVISVSGDQIFVSLADHDGKEPASGVPASMSVDVPSAAGPTPLMIGQPGTFILVSLPAGYLLCMVIGIDMKEERISSVETKRAGEDALLLLDRVSRVLSTVPVGTLDTAGTFERGADTLPTVNAPAFAVNAPLLNKVYAGYADGDFSLGALSLIPSQAAKINLDAFLTRHAAILGQTGGGKSWTVASVVQKLTAFPQSTVVLFDLHGEYGSTFGDDADVISAVDLELPYWLMNSEELLGLMVDRSESAAPNQIAKFKELLQGAKESHLENAALGIPKITIDTPVFFDFSKLINEFRRLDTEMVPGANGKDKQGPLFGQFTRLLMRIDSRTNDRRYDLIFNPKKYVTSASMDDLFRRLLGEVSGARKKAVIIDLSSVPFDVRTSVISLILRCLFDFAYWYRRVKGDRYPIAVFADEAHIYLSDRDTNAEAARMSAERIAKEGRKYGISLTVISQRPRELSSTILSQCGSFLCLRISNPDDQAYVRNLLPDSVRGIAAMFTTLRRGEAILLGDSVMMPTRIRIDAPRPSPASQDASFAKAWANAPTDLDMTSVLTAWRNQMG
jgi:DNA helicase HerA-like ATPase